MRRGSALRWRRVLGGGTYVLPPGPQRLRTGAGGLRRSPQPSTRRTALVSLPHRAATGILRTPQAILAPSAGLQLARGAMETNADSWVPTWM